MRYLSKKQCLYLLAGFLIILILNHLLRQKHSIILQHIPTILWWTPILEGYSQTKQCGLFKCIVTTNRSALNDLYTKAVIFYGSDLNITDLPLPRSQKDIWGLLHEESPKNIPYIQFESALKHFNITATPSRFSSMPLTLQYLESIETLTTRKYMIPIGEKSKLRLKQSLAPVAFVQSICDTMSGREEYVQELMKYIEIDSYGKCLNNKKLPESLTTDYLSTIESGEFYRFLARYKFIFAYENGVCNDYITEKFWRPLIIGSIPIYYGSPTIEDWMPNKKSAILIKDYNSPAELAEYLKYLDRNDVEYNKYLDHKYAISTPIANIKLTKELLERDYVKENFFEDFECFMCKKLYNSNFKSIADKSHYDCGEKLQFPRMGADMKRHEWHSIVKQGKCEADIFNDFLIRNKNFSHSDYTQELVKRFNLGLCKV